MAKLSSRRGEFCCPNDGLPLPVGDAPDLRELGTTSLAGVKAPGPPYCGCANEGRGASFFGAGAS